MSRSLRTWRLTPRQHSDLWSQSSYRGEVWVRAHDAVEARSLTAQRFRIRPLNSDRRVARLESPWYLRELTRCELAEDPRFRAIELACVVFPLPNGKGITEIAITDVQGSVLDQELATDAANTSIPAHVDPASHQVMASDVRREIVRLLLAKGINLGGRWLDVYAAEAADQTMVYIIVPTAKLRRLIAQELAPLINCTLDEQEIRWILGQEEIDMLLGTTQVPPPPGASSPAPPGW